MDNQQPSAFFIYKNGFFIYKNGEGSTTRIFLNPTKTKISLILIYLNRNN